MVSLEDLMTAGIAAAREGRTREAVAYFDEVVERFGDASELSTRRSVAQALGEKAGALRDTGEAADSLGVHDELIRRFGDDADEYLRLLVSIALDRKAQTLTTLGRYSEALRVREVELERYESAEPEGRPLARVAAVEGRAGALSELGREDEAVTAWGEVLETVAGAEDREARVLEARALYFRGAKLRVRGEYQAALIDLEALSERFGRDEGRFFARMVAFGLLEQVLVWDEMGMPAPAEVALDRLIAEFGSDDQPAIANVVTRALYYRAKGYRDRGDTDAARELYDVIRGRARETSDTLVWEAASLAAEDDAQLLAQNDAFDDALIALDRGIAAVAEHLADDETYLTRLLRLKISVFAMSGRDKDVVRLANEIVERFGDSNEPTTRLTVALALVEQTMAFGRLGRVDDSSAAAAAAHEYPEEALRVLDEQVGAAHTDADPSAGRYLVPRLLMRAMMLSALDRDEESAEAFDSLIERFSGSDDAAVRASVELARVARAELTDDT